MKEEEESHNETLYKGQIFEKPKIIFDFQTPHDERPYHELDERSVSIQTKSKARKDASSKGYLF